MNRRNFLCALAAVPVVAALSPLLPALPKLAEPTYYDPALLARMAPSFDPLNQYWDLGLKTNDAAILLDDSKFLRVEWRYFSRIERER